MASERVRQPLAPRALALGHLRAAAALALERPAIATRTRSPADDPALDEVVGDRDEELRLVGIEGERDDPGPERAADVLGVGLQRVDRVERAGVARPGGRPGATSSARSASSPGLGSADAGARLEPPLGLAQLVLERARSGPRTRFRRLGADGRRDPLERGRRARAASASAATPVRASMRRIPEPMLRSPVITKPPIWPVARQCVPPHSSKL